MLHLFRKTGRGGTFQPGQGVLVSHIRKVDLVHASPSDPHEPWRSKPLPAPIPAVTTLEQTAYHWRKTEGVRFQLHTGLQVIHLKSPAGSIPLHRRDDGAHQRVQYFRTSVRNRFPRRTDSHANGQKLSPILYTFRTRLSEPLRRSAF